MTPLVQETHRAAKFWSLMVTPYPFERQITKLAIARYRAVFGP
ncbi:hypothetical protein ACVWY3_004851 [Bradyrhizobium sp. USDA 4486]